MPELTSFFCFDVIPKFDDHKDYSNGSADVVDDDEIWGGVDEGGVDEGGVDGGVDEEPARCFCVHALLCVGAKGQMGRQVPVVIIL